MPISITGFFGKSKENPEAHPRKGIKEASMAMVVPLCLTALISVILGFYPDFFMNLINLVVK